MAYLARVKRRCNGTYTRVSLRTARASLRTARGYVSRCLETPPSFK